MTMTEIYLRSHDSLNELTLRIVENIGNDSNEFIVTYLCLKGFAYDRLGAVNGKPISDSDRSDYEINLPQVVIQSDVLLKISAALSKWQDDFESFEITMSNAFEQKMTFSLEILEDFICSKDRPVAIIRYSVHRIAIESRFVVDCSSLTEFENELNRAITSIT